MSRFLVLYWFHRADAMSLRRLIRLRSMNPDATIIPCFGVTESLYLPTGLGFRGLRFLDQFARRLNCAAMRSSHLYTLSRTMNIRVDSFRQATQLRSLREMLRSKGFDLYLDFTPLKIDLNLDLAMIDWFATKGRFFHFDYLIFYEYDIYTTKPIAAIYEEYTRSDAAFVRFREATPEWWWYHYPPGSRTAILKWLKQKGFKPVLYACVFAGNMISKNALEKLIQEPLPYGKSEMRLPTVLSALGFKCAGLNFPMVSYAPPLSRTDIDRFPGAGIYHPVKVDL